MVEDIYQIIRRINIEQQTSILLVEQNARAALGISHFAYVMENGRVVLSGPAAELKDNQTIRESYLGLSSGKSRKSYRDIKHYRGKKRWLA
jgi:branched-chain amino acid transport system ATP-binding protein